jgi:hypothetical protein
MAAGATIKHKRKAGAFTGGELAAGEIGVDVSNGDIYFSVNGTTVVHIDVSAIGGGGGGFTDSAGLASSLDDETGTGVAVFNDTPTLVTPVLGAATATSINAITITDPGTGATLTLADNSTLSTVGEFPIAFTATGSTALTLPTSGTLATQDFVAASTAGLLDYKGAYNASTNSPDLDVSPSGVLQGDSYAITVAGAFFTVNVEVGDFIIAEQDNPTLAAHWTIIQRREEGLAVTSSSLAQFAATTSAELRGVLSDETGGGLAVFNDSPTILTPTIASIINSGTLTLPTSTDTLVGRATTDTLTNKTISAASNTIDGGTI